MNYLRSAVFALCVFAVASTAHARVVVNEMNEIPFEAFIPCADDGNGELAAGTIRLHALVRETFDRAGGRHFGAVFHPMNGELIGMTTDDLYVPVGRTGDMTNVGAGGLPLSASFVNQFKLVGPGDAVTYTVHENLHVTVNANGELTADVENVRITCE